MSQLKAIMFSDGTGLDEMAEECAPMSEVILIHQL